jgi:hypothetical protein
VAAVHGLRHDLARRRRAAVEALRRLRGRARLRPPSPRVVPCPARHRGAPAMRLTHVLLACDLNPHYLDCWPLARRAWSEVAELEPVLVLVGEPERVPPELAADPGVRVFDPVDAVHTAFQAQCIRLLYPALLDAPGAVVVSDVDMVPLRAGYFHGAAARIPETHFLAYRNVLLAAGETPICYNAALPRTWASVFGISTAADVRDRLEAWAAEATGYDGFRGGTAWDTDQRILHRTLLERGRRERDVWILDDWYTGFRRLERGPLKKRGLDGREARRIADGAYSDYHLALPHAEFAALNESVVAAASGRRGGRRGSPAPARPSAS